MKQLMFDAPEIEKSRLRRSMNSPLLVLYVLGTTIGAGICALVGGSKDGAGIYVQSMRARSSHSISHAEAPLAPIIHRTVMHLRARALSAGLTGRML